MHFLGIIIFFSFLSFFFFLKNNIYTSYASSSKLPEKVKTGMKILVGLAVLELLIKT